MLSKVAFERVPVFRFVFFFLFFSFFFSALHIDTVRIVGGYPTRRLVKMIEGAALGSRIPIGLDFGSFYQGTCVKLALIGELSFAVSMKITPQHSHVKREEEVAAAKYAGKFCEKFYASAVEAIQLKVYNTSGIRPAPAVN